LKRIYRVLRKPFARTPFDGEGAYRYGGRWSSVGTRLSYASEHESLAQLEYFVHVDKDDPPDDLVLAVAEIPENVRQETIEIADLPANWRNPLAPPELAAFGDNFAQQGKTLLLLAPSVLAPSENNCLVNPVHADFKQLVVREPQPLNYDPRMFAKRRRRH
jgi:RES domain-containing protein